MAAEEVFSNPVAPIGESFVDEKPHKLTNADFRKLLMTPRAPSTGTKDSSVNVTLASQSTAEVVTKAKDVKVDEKSSERKKKKSYYARIKKEEEEKMAELNEKYRDRARERRDGKNPDYVAEDPTQSGVGAYRAVAPDVKSGLDAVERRKQMIQESKFLGGDMEHTHLVKGLDYALLQKVRSEILIKVQEVEPEGVAAPPPEVPREKEVEDEELSFKTSIGKRTYNLLFDAKQNEFNENFVPGRMAYCYYLEEDVETDIPITVIRSKTDNMALENRQVTFTTNDIVIDKLTQIFSYLRTGRTNKSKKKKDKTKETEKVVADENIYPEIGEYVPAASKPEKERPREKERHRDRERRDRGDRDRERDRRDRYRNRHDESGKEKRSYFNRPGHEELRAEKQIAEERLQTRWSEGVGPGVPEGQMTEKGWVPKSGSKRFLEYTDNYYTECYPGMAEMQDTLEDSDDEADYTKMDLGNKKGPVGRWDFDTQEEYSEYMNQREAMPKAAFQYGVKMADGRKTRRIGGNKEKDRNAELNREWQQIQQILKRRGEGDAARAKRTKYDY